MTKFIIKDWLGNVCFGGKEFDSSRDAWDYLAAKHADLVDRAFHEKMSEYSVIEAKHV